jgi:acetyl esterase/lipase
VTGAALAFALLAAPPAASPSPSPAAAVAARRLAGEFVSLANITYTVAGGVELKLDVYRPRTIGAPRPTLVFVHGGGWVDDGKEGAVLWLVPWLEAGWAAVNVEYRVARQAHAPAAVEDVRCALRWVFRYARDHGLDPERIVVSGDSAGGHLALMAAMVPESAGFDRGCAVPYPAGTNAWVKVPEWTVRPAAVVSWYAITDVAEMLDGPGARAYAIEWLGSRPDRDAVARLLSPLTHVRAGVPPVITVHGDADPVVPYANASRLHAALETAGVRNRLVTVPGGVHGRFGPAETDRAYDAIAAFLDEVFNRRSPTAPPGSGR